ncbi:hypothetical protein Tco_0756992, partial [Tanacetum coccineum]
QPTAKVGSNLTPLPSNTTAPISSTDIVPSSSATDLDSDRIEVWSMLTNEQRSGVIDIVGVQLESLLSDDNDITSEKPSDHIVQS